MVIHESHYNVHHQWQGSNRRIDEGSASFVCSRPRGSHCHTTHHSTHQSQPVHLRLETPVLGGAVAGALAVATRTVLVILRPPMQNLRAVVELRRSGDAAVQRRVNHL